MAADHVCRARGSRLVGARFGRSRSSSAVQMQRPADAADGSAPPLAARPAPAAPVSAASKPSAAGRAPAAPRAPAHGTPPRLEAAGLPRGGGARRDQHEVYLPLRVPRLVPLDDQGGRAPTRATAASRSTACSATPRGDRARAARLRRPRARRVGVGRRLELAADEPRRADPRGAARGRAHPERRALRGGDQGLGSAILARPARCSSGCSRARRGWRRSTCSRASARRAEGRRQIGRLQGAPSCCASRC